jgi:hypothetical protein
VKTEAANIFKDMGLLAKNPKIEGLKAREKGNNLAKEIDRMRIRVEEICRMMEDSSGKKSTDINRIENGKLREIVAKQAEEIEKLRRNIQQFPVDFIDTSDPQTPIAAGQPTSTLFKSSTPDPVMFQISSSPSLPADRLTYEHQSYQISPAEPISFKEDLDKLTQGQVTMMSDLKNLHKALENITGNPTIPQGNSVSAVSEGNASLGIMLKAIRTAAPHIRARDDAEMLHQFVSETLEMREEVNALLAAVREIGCEADSLREVEAEFRKLRGQYQELCDEHDEITLKMIKTQSEAELNSDFYQNRILELETQLETAKKTSQPLAAMPQANVSALQGVERLLAALPALKPMKEPTHRPTDSRANYYEEEIALLSGENFAFLGKIETFTRERTKLQEKISLLEKKLQVYQSQMGTSLVEAEEMEPPKLVEILKSGHNDPKSSFESAPGGTEEAFDHQSGEIHSKNRLKKISILETPLEEGKTDSAD